MADKKEKEDKKTKGRKKSNTEEGKTEESMKGAEGNEVGNKDNDQLLLQLIHGQSINTLGNTEEELRNKRRKDAQMAEKEQRALQIDEQLDALEEKIENCQGYEVNAFTDIGKVTPGAETGGDDAAGVEVDKEKAIRDMEATQLHLKILREKTELMDKRDELTKERIRLANEIMIHREKDREQEIITAQHYLEDREKELEMAERELEIRKRGKTAAGQTGENTQRATEMGRRVEQDCGKRGHF